MRTELSGAGRVSHHKTCVVYEAHTGKIVHVHESITIEGGTKVTDESLERRARELAASHFEADPTSVSVLVLEPSGLPDAEGPFMVDIKKKVIVVAPKNRMKSAKELIRGAKRAGGKLKKKVRGK